jgi:hypothetical protein
VFQLCFNLHDSVGKALRTVNQDRVTANSHALSSSFHPGLRQFTAECRYELQPGKQGEVQTAERRGL